MDPLTPPLSILDQHKLDVIVGIAYSFYFGLNADAVYGENAEPNDVKRRLYEVWIHSECLSLTKES